MAWAMRHPHTTRGTRVRTEGVTTIRWPRGLALIGLSALLVSAWGGIVPYVGPIFGYSSNGSPAWNWTFQHALLYLIPGAVGVVVSLAVMSRAGGGRGIARASLGLSGLILVACGAWFVVGPAVWPIFHSGAVFSAGKTATTHFVNVVGYNLGVGVVLAALGGMIMKASTPEREIAAERVVTNRAGTEPVADRTVASRREAGAPVADRTVSDRTVSDRTMADRTMANRSVADPTVADREVAERRVAQGRMAGEGPVTRDATPTTEVPNAGATPVETEGRTVD